MDEATISTYGRRDRSIPAEYLFIYGPIFMDGTYIAYESYKELILWTDPEELTL